MNIDPIYTLPPNKINDIVTKHDIKLEEPKYPIFKQYGIGDLLFIILFQRKGMIKRLNFNLAFFDKTLCDYFDEPINALDFRIQLLKDFNVDVDYMYLPDIKFNHCQIDRLISKIENFKLDIPLSQKLIEEPYIVLHTKVRLGPNIKHRLNLIKKYVSDIFSRFKSNYKIVIMGEKNFNCINECNSFITIIYQELTNATKYNDVIDLTIDSIHDQLNYSRFKQDIAIIQGAECNVTFGWGGPFCLSLIFGKKCMAYIDQLDYQTILTSDNLKKNNTFLYENIEKFTEEFYKNYSL